MNQALIIEGVSKRYRLGEIGGRSFRESLGYWSRGVMGKSVPVEDKRDFWALKDISFEIKEGETVGIVGANGAGKSTLLKIISRITAPSSGAVTIRGRVGSLLEVGTGFHPDLSGRDNVFLNGAILGMSRSEVSQKFDAIVDFAGLEKFIDTPVKRYSSGMYVRLAFAVAAFLEPEILIFDEVFSVGDQGFQNKCMERIAQLLKDGRTLLLVSHSMQAIIRTCTRAIELEHGKIAFDGPAEQAALRYAKEVQTRSPCAMYEWPDVESAPGDGSVRLLAIRVLDPLGNPTASFPCSSGLRLEMEYRILKEEASPLVPVFQLYDASSIPLFTTMDTNPETRRVIKKPGLYRSVAHVPPNYLAPGRAFLAALCASMPQGAIHFNERTSIYLEINDDSGEGTMRGDYAGSYPGVLRPKMDWETVKL